MQAIVTVYVLALIAGNILCSAHPARRPVCEGCGDECDKCEFGVTKSALCGISECRKGPGEVCGGPSNSWGICGDGLICSCNRCAGCSIDSLVCFTNMTCLPHQSLESRHMDFLNRLAFK
ncbi:neuroparsin-A [Orussus abietinus]|uniref:neuroparsin-A n=1 Tax=Orussus abietinus TaxID=222816 RepID=UPI0006260ACE|nr:neuroparsin-A [Orussus abietinus]XP_012285341.1 neuroparsin-A [Orussus abietinus]XP_012285342.1 neuroparsin-A [Orussus abietinus]